MATKLDALSAYSAGRAQVEEWKAKFQREWNRPILEAMAIAQWKKLPPEAQEIFKREKPEEYKKLMEILSRYGGKTNGTSER